MNIIAIGFDVLIGYDLFYKTVILCENVIAKKFMFILCFIYMYIRINMMYIYLSGAINIKDKESL